VVEFLFAAVAFDPRSRGKFSPRDVRNSGRVRAVACLP